jgi:hypothetical protein
MATDVHNDEMEPVSTVPAVPGESPAIARSKSLLDRAKAKRAERESHLFIDVPSWDGDLIAEYRVLGAKELDVMSENAARKIRAGESDQIHADLDLIAKAAVGLHMIDPESGDRVPLEDDNGKVGYDRAAHVLGVFDDPTVSPKVDSVYKTINFLFGEKKEGGQEGEWVENPTAVTMHAQRIARWMRDPSKSGLNVLEEILGES